MTKKTVESGRFLFLSCACTFCFPHCIHYEGVVDTVGKTNVLQAGQKIHEFIDHKLIDSIINSSKKILSFDLWKLNYMLYEQDRLFIKIQSKIWPAVHLV